MVHRLQPTGDHKRLCALLRTPYGDDVSTASGMEEDANPSSLLAAAERNLVKPIVAHRLQGQVPLLRPSEAWQCAHKISFQQVSGYMAALDAMAHHMAQAGIAVVALKNAGIARGIYPCVGCCPMGDVDVLIERRHLRQAHDILLSEGYEPCWRHTGEDFDFDAAERIGGAEYRKTLENGETMWLEVQWRPVAGRWIRPDQEPTAEELIARSVPIPGTAVRLLAPEDNLLQVALHTAKHSYVRAPGFRLHLDVERIVRLQSIDWDTFVRRVVALRVKTPVYFSLAIPRLLFDTPVPDEVLRALRPSAWKERLLLWWIDRAGLFNPDERKFSKVGFVVFSALLYDDLSGLWRALFPDPEWMRRHYGLRNSALLPIYHARRLVDLAFRRSL